MSGLVKRFIVAAAIVLCSCAALQTWLHPLAAPTRVTVFMTASLEGSIEPCGCSEHMRGGLSRTAALIAQARQKPDQTVLFIDSGSALFANKPIPDAAVDQQERKASTIAQAFTSMGLTIRSAGPGDDARTARFHSAFQLPELESGGTRLLDVKGHTLAVVHAPSLSEADRLAARARGRGAAFVIALLPTSLEVAMRELLDASNVDLAVASTPKDELSAESNRLIGATTRVAQLQSKGRSVLQLDLVLRDRERATWLAGPDERELAALDERIEITRAQVNDPSLTAEMKALREAKLDDLVARRATLAAAHASEPTTGNVASARFVAIEANLPKEPAVAELERTYNHDVGALNLAWAKEHGVSCAAPSATAPGLVGSAVCGACHLEAQTIWQASKHSRAYAALEREGKQYHLDCVGCHVAGWQKPGGVCRIDETEGRREVACESCHGPGSAHVANPVKGSIGRSGREVCITCHDHDNSPAFDFDTYVKLIRGPGHGLPKLDAGVPLPR